MVCWDQSLLADFTKKGVNGAYTPTGLLKISPLSFRLVSHGGNSTIFFELGVSIYEILDAEPESVRKLKLASQKEFEKGLNFYFARDFNTAAKYFSKVLDTNAIDLAAQIYLQQCNIYHETVPDSEWNGTITIDSK